MKRFFLTLIITFAMMTAKSQTYGDEGPTLTPNAFGLVYENAISKNENGKVNLQRVNYKIDGIDVVANVYKPAGYDPKKSYAAVVVAHPNGGSKDQVAGLYAQKLAEAGFITIAFDARYQGESGGLPRRTDKELFIVPGATHIRTYFVEEYVSQISAKIQKFFTEKL